MYEHRPEDEVLDFTIKQLLTEGGSRLSEAFRRLADYGDYTARDIKEVQFILKHKKAVDIEDGGKGTIWLNSLTEFEEVMKEFEGELLSPSAAATEIGISRARIHQMEMEGKIRAYRFKPEFFESDQFSMELRKAPFWLVAMFNGSLKSRSIYIPKIDLLVFQHTEGETN
ncbi:MAG: hypothetical protein HOH13_05170 [Crocinitomicaceae bacterium]|nr:hypothetical protein [Crocinitomicaceae bacterium]